MAKASDILELNPLLDRAALQAAFAKTRRLHIPDILTREAAQRIHQCLTSEVDWHLVFNEGEKVHTLYPVQVKALTEAQKSQIRQIVVSQARKGFQFLYNDYNIYDYYLNGKDREHFLARFHEFLNSEAFLSFIREITGFASVRFADSQATAYGPGHFLTQHHDEIAGKNRKLAYVFNFTPGWKMDWGGILQFLGRDGNVECGFVPTFNALNLFAVPQDHAVSYVAPFAPAIRYSITGWLRETDDAAFLKKIRG
ncbi:MAG TPA: 2OG-Fe(II) oxygenase family protein [Sphingomonadales bacterium]|nr:2OG-Fe(II) oxygenase family protein [Sphingomonadales bacterium]